MTQQNSEAWAKARRVQHKLDAQFLNHPDVTLIDIAYKHEAGKATEQPAVRIHVRADWFNAKPEDRIDFPKQVDGIAVLVIPGEYRVGE